MRLIKRASILILLSLLSGCASEAKVRSPIRVLFVGNSITYYHGVPYLFSVISSELHNAAVTVNFLVQPGGHLAEVLDNESVISELKDTRYDVVILQEWGGQLLCAADAESRVSQSCTASLEAHRLLAEATSGNGASTVLLGTYQPNEQVARALLAGEKWFFNTLQFDSHVKIAPLFLAGESEFPLFDWTANDGIHPGPALSLAIAFATADAVFGSTTVGNESIVVRRTNEKPKKSFTYQNIENDLRLFYDDPSSIYEPETLRSIAKLVNSVEVKLKDE